MDKAALRQQLIIERENLDDKMRRIHSLTQVLRIWLFARADLVIGAYWPIKGEYDPLPALHRWKEDGELLDLPQPRRIGLPVVDKLKKNLQFHVWYPGCEMEEDAYHIPKPKDTDIIMPSVLLVPCVGFTRNASGALFRLGYGGGFYDRTLSQLQSKPFTVGLAFDCAHADFPIESHDMPLDAMLTENGQL